MIIILNILTNILIIIILIMIIIMSVIIFHDQYASGFRRGRTREEAVPVEGTSALNRPPTQKTFTKNSFQFIKAAREGVSLTLPQSSSFDPYLSDHFLASNVKM